jgi:hypothetical protein
MSFTGAGARFFCDRSLFARSGALCSDCSTAGKATLTLARAPRTIVVQDAVRPYLTGACATNRRDFHKVFHNFCGSIPEQPIQRR